jgi:hypothetical protein
MGSSSAEARVNQEVQWMKSEFNLDSEKEQRLHDVLLKYEKQGTSSTASSSTNEKEKEKEKEIKAIIGDDNYKIYKEKYLDKQHSGQGAAGQSSSSVKSQGSTSGSSSSSKSSGMSKDKNDKTSKSGKSSSSTNDKSGSSSTQRSSNPQK